MFMIYIQVQVTGIIALFYQSNAAWLEENHVSILHDLASKLGSIQHIYMHIETDILLAAAYWLV